MHIGQASEAHVSAEREVTKLQAENAQLRTDAGKARAAFAPVADWYGSEGSDDSSPDEAVAPAFAEMIRDAVADLQQDRKEALLFRGLLVRVAANRSGSSDEYLYHELADALREKKP